MLELGGPDTKVVNLTATHLDICHTHDIPTVIHVLFEIFFLEK